MEGSLVLAEVDCITAKVQMAKYTFHPTFLKDLARATDTATMLPLLYKYGTHFYNRATLGGRLRQLTVVSKSMLKQKSSSEISQHVDWSFSASLAVPSFSADGSYSKTRDVSVTQEQQSEFESESIRSNVITYGGAPGSYGPNVDTDAPTDFGTWASSVDLLPVPISYELMQISQVIPESWTTPVTRKSLKQLWQEAEDLYYKVNGVFGTRKF